MVVMSFLDTKPAVLNVPLNPSGAGPRATGAPAMPWHIAEQYFRYSDFEIETKPHNDGYVATIRLGFKTRRVFFDPAGRITHVLNLNDPAASPEQPALPLAAPR